jgi:hypothetical protein
MAFSKFTLETRQTLILPVLAKALERNQDT